VEKEFTIIRQEHGYAGINAIGVTTNGEIITANSLDDFPRTRGGGLTRVIKNPPVEHAMSAPVKVYFDPTKICPLGCDHCLANVPAIKESKMIIPTLRRDEVREIVNQIISSGTMETKLGGGEPFIYKPFWDAVEELGNAGISISTSTSGVTLSNERALSSREIELLKNKNVKISLSVDGNPDYHDRLRKKEGLLADILSVGIERLLGNGINRNKIEFRSTILHTEESVNQLEYLDQLATSFKIRTRIRLARPAGGAIINNVAILKPDAMTINIIEKLRKMAQNNPYINLEEFLKFDTVASMKTGLDCGAGTRAMYVDAGGKVTTCVFLDGFFTKSHDILKGSQKLLEVWQNGEAFLEVREYLQKENAENSCKDCANVDACQGGGCPSVRLTLDLPTSPLCPAKILKH